MNLAHRGNRACLPPRGLHPLLKRGSPSLTLLTQQEPHPVRHKILDSQFSSWRELTLDPQFSFHCGLVILTEAKAKRKKKKKKGVTGKAQPHPGLCVVGSPIRRGFRPAQHCTWKPSRLPLIYFTTYFLGGPLWLRPEHSPKSACEHTMPRWSAHRCSSVRRSYGFTVLCHKVLCFF